MKKLYTILIFTISMLLVGNLANAQLLNLWIDGDRVVYDVPNGKYFNPNLPYFFNKTYGQQDAMISALEYAKIDDWRWANYADMMPLRISMFGFLNPDQFNRVFGKNITRFFMYTAFINVGLPGYVTHGRTGDEEGDPAESGSGAKISAHINPIIMPTPLAPRYVTYGTRVYPLNPDQEKLYYTLPRADYPAPYYNKGSEAQDHWFLFDPAAGGYMFNDDLNYMQEDATYVNQDVDPDAKHPLGAWTVYGGNPGDMIAPEMPMDVKPGSWPNSINLKSKGVLPVAILTTDVFDATTIDPHSILVGSDPGFPIAHKDGHVEDVDKDGDLDLVLHFNVQELGLWPGDELWGFYAETYGAFGEKGYIFMDEIRIVDTGKKKGNKKSADVDLQVLNFNVDVYPNPFTHETNIRFHLPEAGHVTMKIHNMLGQEIQILANTPYKAGTHVVQWDGTDMSGNEVPGGIYIYRIQVGDNVLSDRIQLIR